MPFDGEEFLRLAEFLKQYTGTDFTAEAALRAGVSRAYYAALGVARTVALAEGYIALETAEDHQRLRDHFGRTRLPDIGTKLTTTAAVAEPSRLQRRRRQPPYDDQRVARRGAPGSEPAQNAVTGDFTTLCPRIRRRARHTTHDG